MKLLLPAEAELETSFGDTLIHVTCEVCDPVGVMSFCGKELPPEDWEDADSGSEDCVVCIEQGECPSCGAGGESSLYVIFDEVIHWNEQG